MGIYDREYYRDDRSSRPGLNIRAPQTIVVTLILANAAVYLADIFSDGFLSNHFALWSDWPRGFFQRPWIIVQPITYGFLHDTQGIGHIVFNMFALYIFGRDVEGIYGKSQFLRVYLSTVIVSGLAWLAINLITSHDPRPIPIVGASGGVMGLMILSVLHFPKRVFYIYGIIPIASWLLGVLYVGFDIVGAIQGTGHVANTAHLAGVASGYIFYRTGWHLLGILPSWRLPKFNWHKPKMKLHVPDEPREEDDMSERVDEILAKIHRSGESSLSNSERRFLQEASRRFQKKDR